MTKQEFLAISLPYELHGIIRNRVALINGIEYEKELPITWKGERFTGKCGFNIKPILHPLTDLTKEIEHKGERFVPIVELAKLANVETIGRAEFSKQTEFQTHFYVDYINKRVRKRFQLRRLTFEKEGIKLDFEYFYPYRNGFLYVDNQFMLFTKLIEWHFDLFNGIESGEAIDVNTLNENPYK